MVRKRLIRPKWNLRFSKNNCIWTAVKNCASTCSIIHFYVFLMVPEVFKGENSLKMAIFDLKWNPRFSIYFYLNSTKNGHFWPKMCYFWQKMKSEIFEKYLYLKGRKNCTSTNSIIHFYAYLWYLGSSKVKIVRKWLFLT